MLYKKVSCESNYYVEYLNLNWGIRFSFGDTEVDHIG